MVTNVADSVLQDISKGSQSLRSNWYLSRREIEDNSPSRKDGIDLKKENQLRKLYCSFLHDVGMKLKVPQETIATAMMLCHRFFLRQSHAKNEWQTIATVSMFLASKLEETPCLLMDVIVVAYETMYRRDPFAAQRIKQKEVYEKQKQLILTGETLLLCTIGFDFNIQHPYKPLTAAAKRLKIAQNVWKSAWSYVNDWLRTALCLQYKPHYIAAGSMYLAAKFHKVKLPSEKGMVWWQQFDVTPQQLEEVIQQMNQMRDQNRSEVPCTYDKARQTPAAPEKGASTISHSALSGSVVTGESGHIHDKGILLLSSANSVNPNLPCSRVLACGDSHFANKGDSQCQLHAKENAVSMSVYLGNNAPEKVASTSSHSALCGSVVTSESGHIHDKDIGLLSSANSVNPDLQSSRVLACGDIHFANKGDLQCQLRAKENAVSMSVYSVNNDSPGHHDLASDEILPSHNGDIQRHPSDCGSAHSVVEDCGRFNEVTLDQAMPSESDQIVGSEMISVSTCLTEMAKDRIRSKLKRRRLERSTDKMVVITCSANNEDAWIEKELENGIDVKEHMEKKPRC